MSRFSLIRLLPLSGRTLFVGLAVCALVRGVLPAAFAILMGLVVDNLLKSTPTQTLWRGFAAAGSLLVGAAVLQHSLAAVQVALEETAAEAIDSRLRAKAMELALGPPGIDHLERPDLRDVAARSWGLGTGYTPGSGAAALATIAVWRISAITAALILLWFHWWLALLLAGSHLLILQQFRLTILTSPAAARSTARTLRRAEYFFNLGVATEYAKEIRVFSLSNWIYGHHLSNSLMALMTVWRRRFQTAPLGLAGIVGQALLAIVSFGLLGRVALRGEITLGQLAVFTQSLFTILSVNVGTPDLRIAYGEERLDAMRKLEAATIRSLAPKGVRRPTNPPAHAIEFKDIWFRYPGGSHDILAGLSLRIRPGQSLAIVGTNGAGKTTLIKLLARLYDPTHGRIVIDGVDLREYDPVAWQPRVAVLFQDFVRYKLSAEDNVILGAADRAKDTNLRWAVRRAGVSELIEGLPQGWQTLLSSELQGGVDLSAGEWQRIALARVLFALRSGAWLLVLDEPTANLDVRAEADFFDRFLQLTQGITTIIISHRFPSVRRADAVCVLEAGRIVESGSHDELLALGGRYARMFRLQAEQFGVMLSAES